MAATSSLSQHDAGSLVIEQQNEKRSRSAEKRRFPPRAMLLLLLISLPLANPWVRGDGVGYYAFARAPLTQGDLDFAPDYQHANQGFREARLDESGAPKEIYRTTTGHLDNHFTVGPAMLWAPFLLCAHAGVLAARAFGAHVLADGFSLPYLMAMALGTLLYGFLALVLSYRVACRFVAERWALLATVTIWWASSLPVYMYFNPSWSHAHSAFAVALFFWYWLRTREQRTIGQWITLGLLGALMMNVYYPNALALAVLIPEALASYRGAFRRAKEDKPQFGALVGYHVLFCTVALAGMLPTFISRYIVYGGFLESGYIPITMWAWKSPWFLAVLFSANHGLFSWTPILLVATAGMFLFWRREPTVGSSMLCVVLAFYYFMASYPDWAGISSYGNRFFVSLTVFFVVGLSAAIEWVGVRIRNQRTAWAGICATLTLFVVWNLGLIFQWGSHLVPARGPVSWSQVARNQFGAVPRQIASHLESYLFRRKDELHEIEQRDIEQLNRQTTP